jgi:hypothetical protein
MNRKTIAATILTTGLTLAAAPAAFAWDLTATVSTSCTGTNVNVNAAASRPHAADFTVRTVIDGREASLVRVRYTRSNNVFTIPSLVPLDGLTHQLYVQLYDHDGDLAAATAPQDVNCTPPAPAPPVVVPVPPVAAPLPVAPVPPVPVTPAAPKPHHQRRPHVRHPHPKPHPVKPHVKRCKAPARFVAGRCRTTVSHHIPQTAG